MADGLPSTHRRSVESHNAARPLPLRENDPPSGSPGECRSGRDRIGRRPRRAARRGRGERLDSRGAARPYLRRSLYSGRVGERFTVGGFVLTLTAVTDVLGAQTDPSLKGHEDAFTLEFEGRADALPDDVYEVAHAQIGPFPLFLGPAGAVRGLAQTYCATVDRTVRIGDVPGEPDAAAPVASAMGDADAPPSPRDEAIIAERVAAAQTPRVLRRKAARRTHTRIRRAQANRVRFKRKQRLERKRLARVRGGWLSRHGR